MACCLDDSPYIYDGYDLVMLHREMLLNLTFNGYCSTPLSALDVIVVVFSFQLVKD